MSKRICSPLKKKDSWNDENFSVILLEKEIELEKNCRLDLIEDLITIYSHAIEHYILSADPNLYHTIMKLAILNTTITKKNFISFCLNLKYPQF